MASTVRVTISPAGGPKRQTYSAITCFRSISCDDRPPGSWSTRILRVIDGRDARATSRLRSRLLSHLVAEINEVSTEGSSDRVSGTSPTVREGSQVLEPLLTRGLMPRSLPLSVLTSFNNKGRLKPRNFSLPRLGRRSSIRKSED